MTNGKHYKAAITVYFDNQKPLAIYHGEHNVLYEKELIWGIDEYVRNRFPKFKRCNRFSIYNNKRNNYHYVLIEINSQENHPQISRTRYDPERENALVDIAIYRRTKNQIEIDGMLNEFVEFSNLMDEIYQRFFGMAKIIMDYYNMAFASTFKNLDETELLYRFLYNYDKSCGDVAWFRNMGLKTSSRIPLHTNIIPFLKSYLNAKVTVTSMSFSDFNRNFSTYDCSLEKVEYLRYLYKYYLLAPSTIPSFPLSVVYSYLMEIFDLFHREIASKNRRGGKNFNLILEGFQELQKILLGVEKTKNFC